MPGESLLLEVGSEELPPGSLDTLRQAFAEGMGDGLAKAGFPFAAVEGFATPRRLAVLVSSLGRVQPDRIMERRGPSIKAAYDANGKPTRALLGFAKACKVEDLSELERLENDKGEWLVYRAVQPGRTLDELIEELVVDVLTRLPVARRMRWGKNRAEFVRPVKWICALYGGAVIPVELFGLAATNRSQGHRFMSAGSFHIDVADDYVEACRNHHVMVRFEERRSVIRQQVLSRARGLGARVPIDESLLDEVTALVEWPVALAGSFDESFLEVPDAALVSAMKHHQRYFHLTDDSGTLINRFIAVSNLESTDPALVVSGNEKVLRARLADAAFFFHQDSRRPLADKIHQLDQVVFQTQLGSYGDKTRRITALAAGIADTLSADKSLACRAARLCKADLVTDMVREFPDLQGIMGGHYASGDGEGEAVAAAIAEHYRPIRAGGSLPTTRTGCIIALADKIDSLLGLFGAGLPPTGSRDPFGLRRQSLGIIRICIKKDLDLDLTDPLLRSAELHGFGQEVVLAVQEHIRERLTGWYLEQGIPGDLVKAVQGATPGTGHLADVHRRMTGLYLYRREPFWGRIISADKRTARILQTGSDDRIGGVSFDKKLFSEAAERELANAIEATAEAMAKLHDVGSRLEALAALQPGVDRFFDEVLVMAKDPSVQENRLQLLAATRRLFLEVADFSLLQPE